MSRIPVSALTACLVTALLVPAEAAKKKVQVPDRFDGSWSITAVTKDGPCPSSTSYQVQIKDSDASVPGDEIDVDGGVSQSGAVRATIIKGSNRVPIAGTLDPKGNGSGTWRTNGGIVECSGSWSARRAG
ncbi:heme utilization protein [Methylobacterium sp. WL120]|uniref:heme utilization protein n=1 Tax=Methylobacterium sp. WL120 TaxID=2603887 RepID=UPI0011C75600|nr:heme utilization protein [Methylobacterium sp. WL120]TXM63976.1 heme utilization protein [Methylobacterium sp. WL120]